MSVRSKTAFTLVELLVVVAIIALLIGILLPAVNKARNVAERTACMSNQRSLSQAAASYATQWDDWLGRDGYDNGNRAFTYALLAEELGIGEIPHDILSGHGQEMIDWLENRREIFMCPSVDNDFVLHYGINAVRFERFRMTGTMQQLDNGWRGRPKGWEKVNQVQYPSQTCLFPENNMTTNAPGDISNVNVWAYPDLPFDEDGEPTPDPRMIHAEDERHQGTTTAGYFDGHAEQLDLTPDNFPKGFLDGQTF